MYKPATFKAAVKKPVQNSVDNVLELYFLDAIYNTVEFDWYSGLVETNIVADVIREVKEAAPATIKVIIDSQGGDANIGLAIYNFLKSYDAKVIVEVIGMAGSIASVIAMAANPGKLSMARNAFMVIHRAWGGAEGNSEDLRAAADMIDKYTEQICDIYAQRTGKSVDEIQALIANGDYWMSGKEAEDQGFCDKCLNDNQQFQIAARVTTLDPHYKNVPKNLVPDTDTSISKFVKDSIMEIKTLVSNFTASLKGAKPNENVTVTNEVFAASLEKPLTDFLTEVENQIKNDIANGLKGDAFNTAVTNAIPESKVYKDMAEQVTNLAKENKELSAQLEKIVGGEGGIGKTREDNDQPETIGSFC